MTDAGKDSRIRFPIQGNTVSISSSARKVKIVEINQGRRPEDAPVAEGGLGALRALVAGLGGALELYINLISLSKSILEYCHK